MFCWLSKSIESELERVPTHGVQIHKSHRPKNNRHRHRHRSEFGADFERMSHMGTGLGGVNISKRHRFHCRRPAANHVPDIEDMAEEAKTVRQVATVYRRAGKTHRPTNRICLPRIRCRLSGMSRLLLYRLSLARSIEGGRWKRSPTQICKHGAYINQWLDIGRPGGIMSKTSRLGTFMRTKQVTYSQGVLPPNPEPWEWTGPTWKCWKTIGFTLKFEGDACGNALQGRPPERFASNVRRWRWRRLD